MSPQDQDKIVLDFSQTKNLNEGILSFFGTTVKQILMGLFGGLNIPVEIKGSRSEVDAFAKAISREKRYIESVKDFGLNNPKTFKDKQLLDAAATKFERKTGLKWPFK